MHQPLILNNRDQIRSHITPLLNMQPAGKFLGEEYSCASGLPTIVAELLDAGKLRLGALTCNGKTAEQIVCSKHTRDR